MKVSKREIVMFVALACSAALAERVSFDRDWEFACKDFKTSYCKSGFSARAIIHPNNNGSPSVRADTEGWTRVMLPHDWALSLPYTSQCAPYSGYKAIGVGFPQNSIGWYRKTFAIDTAWSNRCVYLQFDGIYRNAQFWVNGIYLGRNESGYIGRRFNISDLLDYGSTNNFISVRVDASAKEGWWYEGAGIYRHVWLIDKPRAHIVPESVFMRTREVRSGVARVQLEAETTMATGQMTFHLFDTNGQVVASVLATRKGTRFTADMPVAKPRLWSPAQPNLYTLEAEYRPDAATCDRDRTTVGLRIVAFDPNRGMLINGEHVPVQGVCCHQDHAGVGVAIPDGLQDYRVRRLKSMGVNAYRTSHNPPTPELLDACDRHGIVVMDETRMFASSDEGLSQLGRLVRRDRNHPCVVSWSIGNEEINIQHTAMAKRMATTMRDCVRRLDPSRPVTYGANNGVTYKGINEVVDVRGVNYLRVAQVDNGSFDRYHADHPEQPIWGSEEASTLVTRGSEVYFGTTVQQLADNDLIANRPHGWTYSAEEWTTRAAARPWFAGAFAWTGFDYRGECTWPAINCNFGILDLCGFDKNNASYYRARWTDEDVLHLYPHLNMPRTNFWVNTNCDRVELRVNGERVDEQMRKEGVFRLRFPVAFSSGTVEVRGWRKGREVVRTYKTSGLFTRIRLEPDRTQLAADGADATVVNVIALDDAGNEVPTCNERLYFDCKGAGEIIGVGNGNPLDRDEDVCAAGMWTRRFFNGKCQIVLRAATKPGALTLTVRGETAPAVTETLTTR